jgi:hypothetical protein
LLLIRGFRGTYVVLDRASRRDSVVILPKREALEAVADRVAMVSAFYPGRARCLEQALVLWTALRLAGAPAELRFGVKPTKGIAHAWVEVEHEPVGETKERIDLFVSIPLPLFASGSAI